MNTLRTSVITLAIAIVVVSMVAAPMNAWQSTPPDPQKLEDAIGKLEKNFTERESNKTSVLQQVRENQQCAEFFNRITEGYDLIRKDGQQNFQNVSTELTHLLTTIKPITNLRQEEERLRISVNDLKSQKQSLDAEVTDLRKTKAAEERALNRIRQGQKDAIRDWLLREYGQTAGPAATIKLGNRVQVSLNTLFGTFVADYEHALVPGEARETTVTFTPAIFAKDLFIETLELAPDGYSRRLPPESEMEFKETIVSGVGADRPFTLKQREQVDPGKAITWKWATGISEKFRGVEFDIIMNASRQERNNSNSTLTVGRLPIKITRQPTKPFLERYGPLFGNLFGSLVILTIGFVGGRIHGWLKGRQKPIGF